MERFFDQLTQTQVTLQNFFELSPDLLCVLGNEGSFQYSNSIWNSQLGWTVRDLQQRSWFDLIHPDDRQESRDRFLELLQSPNHPQTCLLENRLQEKTGHYSWFLWKLSFTGENRIYAIARDITDRKQSEVLLYQRIQREQALNRVIQTIRNSLDLNTIFSRAVYEIGQLLQFDRVAIVEYSSVRQVWLTVADFRRTLGLSSILGLEISDQNHPFSEQLQNFQIVQIDHSDCWQNLNDEPFDQLYPGAWLIVPLQVGDRLWGCLSLNKLEQPVIWQNEEIELALAVADQLAIAIQQSELYTQVQEFSADLEEQVRQRTSQLQLARDSEETLKRIIDRVRESLDEEKILQTAVQELGKGLGVNSCNVALYDLERGTTIICFEYNPPLLPLKGRVAKLDDYSEIYSQLLQGECFQFCNLQPNPLRGWTAILVCPIGDDQKILGDLWLINDSDYAYKEWEIRLVQQVANQCAIALRQSRLYQAAQLQVQELERLNHLKDDFLSTVSHELKTPMTNIKMSTKMLEIALRRQGSLADEENSFNRYLQILKAECQRETDLICKLLDLSRVESGKGSLDIKTINLKTWIPEIIKPFLERAQNQQQTLHHYIPSNLSLRTDENYLSSILRELLNNACKYTPAGEMITVSARGMREGVQIIVSNSGIEISQIECDRIFDKFYRIPNNDPWKYGGTGLGLALVKKQIEQLKGSIKATSQAKQTTFTIQLPWAI